jgi:hypothetical protein
MTSEASGADFNDQPVDALLVFMLGPASAIARILQGTNFIKALEGGTMRDQYITVGQVGAVGPNAAAHQITFSQAWAGLSDSIDLFALKQELSNLLLALHREARKPEHALAIAEVGQS